ncbi:alpha/beta hydrolase [Kitasatospora purpeofusca]|uniref:alpha/beta hydrolase n=1 Tax=Kitasatospora purpeofusca TaxID=67352 RepID=UPI0033C4C19A
MTSPSPSHAHDEDGAATVGTDSTAAADTPAPPTPPGTPGTPGTPTAPTAPTTGRRHRRNRVITVLASVVGTLAVLVTVLMTVPVPTSATALATLAADALHEGTLIAVLVCAVLAVVARLRRARAATLIAGASAVLMAVMTAVPAVALMREADRQHVDVSIGRFLTHGLVQDNGRPKGAETLTYGTAGPTELKLDHIPGQGPARNPGGTRPAVIYVHGGGWKIGERSDGYPWSKWFAERGYAAFTIDYRLLPHADWQTGPGDVKAAVGYVRDNAARFGVDPSDITLFGESAGGHLAMMAGYTDGDPMFPPTNPHADTSVRRVINFYGTTDLDDVSAHSTAPNIVRQVTREFMGGTKEQRPEAWTASSPLHHVRPGLPATLSVHGADDRLIAPSQLRLLDRALADAGVPHRSVELPWTSHLFDLTRGNLTTQIAEGLIQQFDQQTAR